MGNLLFTGSQEAPLMQGVTESMAGRAAILQLLPFSLVETAKVSLLYGGFPEVLAQPKARGLWFASYLQTYLERDVRSIVNVRDLSTFRRFLSLLASRHGQLLNKTDLAAPLGISVPTIGEWLNILEITGQIILVPPYFENFGKRLVKSPKVYWEDSGLACYLLGIASESELERSPFLGRLFEGFVAGRFSRVRSIAAHARSCIPFAISRVWRWIFSCHGRTPDFGWSKRRQVRRCGRQWPRRYCHCSGRLENAPSGSLSRTENLKRPCRRRPSLGVWRRWISARSWHNLHNAPAQIKPAPP